MRMMLLPSLPMMFVVVLRGNGASTGSTLLQPERESPSRSWDEPNERWSKSTSSPGQSSRKQNYCVPYLSDLTFPLYSHFAREKKKPLLPMISAFPLAPWPRSFCLHALGSNKYKKKSYLPANFCLAQKIMTASHAQSSAMGGSPVDGCVGGLCLSLLASVGDKHP